MYRSHACDGAEDDLSVGMIIITTLLPAGAVILTQPLHDFGETPSIACFTWD